MYTEYPIVFRAYMCEEMYLHFHLAEVRRISAHHRNVNVELPGPYSHTEAVRLEPNPAYETVPFTTANDPHAQYEEVRGGVACCGHVSMVENPAYQSLNATCTTKTKDSCTYQNVQIASF